MKYHEHRIPPKEYDLVEGQYADPKTTTLEINVTSEGQNDFAIDAGKIVRDEYKEKRRMQ